VLPNILLLKSLAGLNTEVKTASRFIKDLMDYWQELQGNRSSDLDKNPEFTTFVCEVTYSRDLENHSKRNLSLDVAQLEYADHFRLFRYIIDTYKIDKPDFNIVQLLLCWIETYTRQYQERAGEKTAAEVDAYIEKMKKEFFPSRLSLPEEMCDANLHLSLENLKNMKLRQEKEKIIAFKPCYLNRYIKKLEEEVSSRRAEIFEDNKENVTR
jgi:hypothetical protein